MAKKKKKEPAVVKTEAKYLPISPRKLRLVVKEVKNYTPQEALRKLKFLNKKPARFLIKAIKTGLADAEHNFKLNSDSLKFKEILVNEGPTWKIRDKSKRQFHYGTLRKRRSHLVVKLIQS